MESKNKKSELSYHIFSFPFKIDSLKGKKEFDKKSNLDDIDKIIDQKYWTKKSMKSLKNEKNEMTEIIDRNLNYNIKTYFYNNVREAIYNNNDGVENNQIVVNYSYNLIGENYYIIEALKEFKDELENNLSIFKLKIDKIELKIYETGVGILSYFLENSNHVTSSDILEINGMGRRIYPPFFDKEEPSEKIMYSKKTKELPYKIQLDMGNQESIVEEFKYKKFSKDIKAIRIGNHILEILKFDKKNISIQPIIDDRMFVISYILKDRLIKACQSKYELESIGHYNELTNGEYENSDYWYKYLYIDSDMMTVQNSEMKKNFISKSTYKRWSNWGTLFGISRYSFVLSKDIEPKFINIHLRTLYYEMVCLILAQRASILNFSDEVSKISSLNNEDTKRINNLYKNYIQFTNRLYFREVSAQEQGIELYNMLLDINNVNNEISNLKEDMEALYQYANFLESEKSKKSLAVIEKLNAQYLIPTFITGLLGINIFQRSFLDIEGFIPNFANFNGIGYFAFIINLIIIWIFIMFIGKGLLKFAKSNTTLLKLVKNKFNRSNTKGD